LTSPLISVARLRKDYSVKNGRLTAIADVSFDLRAGEFLAVVGPSGCRCLGRVPRRRGRIGTEAFGERESWAPIKNSKRWRLRSLYS